MLAPAQEREATPKWEGFPKPLHAGLRIQMKRCEIFLEF